MAADTLRAALHEAAQLMEVDLTQLEALQEPEVRFLGSIALNGETYSAYRGFAGPDGLTGKGGIRFAPYESQDRAVEMVDELAAEMDFKLALRGHHLKFRGAKGLVNINAWDLSHEEKAEVARQYGELLEAKGLLNHTVDVAAGDVGTNGLADIIYGVHVAHHPDDPYAKAVITGKSPQNGGLESRSGATGLGGIVSHFELMEDRGIDKATVALQGFGNVGAWYAYHAATDPEQRLAVQFISEREGVIWTSDPRGLPISEAMVKEIGDNPEWEGPKLEALRDMILSEHPGFDVQLTLNTDENGHTNEEAIDILECEVDYFVPAAMSDVLTGSTVERLGARRGIIELANGPSTAEAHAYMVAKGLDVVIDAVANGAGVDNSIDERQANIDMADGIITEMPDTAVVNAKLIASSKAVTKEVLDMARRLKTTNLRVAAAAIYINRLQERQSFLRAVLAENSRELAESAA